MAEIEETVRLLKKENDELLLQTAHLQRLVEIASHLAETRLQRIEQLQAKIEEILSNQKKR